MNENYDVLVIGGGISGIQASIDLGDQGYKVLLVDKKDSIGGTMIQLSKVFPTLDCASCITTPKMSAAFHHPNIDTRTMAHLHSYKENGDGTFNVEVYQKSRFVNMSDCTGCNECEAACPVVIRDWGYDEGRGPIKAVGVPFATALPQKARLNVENCIFCGKCYRACPTGAIDYSMRDEILPFKVKAVIVSTGFLETPTIKDTYGGGNFKNVITGKQMDRYLAPTGPFGGIFRESDGMAPWSIAYIQCAGSRDASIGVPYCSAVCCMFAIKQAMLLSAAAPLADITIYYMDIRAFGKGHEEFFEDAKAMGVNFVRGKVAKVTELENRSLSLRVEEFGEGGGITEYEHDLVVLSLGMVPQWTDIQKVIPITLDQYGFVKQIRPLSDPVLTSIPGVFVAGTAAEPKDIVDSIMSGSAAAGKAVEWMKGNLKDAYFVKQLDLSTSLL